jgi:cytochrome c
LSPDNFPDIIFFFVNSSLLVQHYATVRVIATTRPTPVAANTPNPLEQGKTLFQACAACHAVNSRLIGPPLTEIARIYDGNPKGIVEWAKAPGKKRAGYPQMPPMSLPDEDLRLIAEYMIHAGGGH